MRGMSKGSRLGSCLCPIASRTVRAAPVPGYSVPVASGSLLHSCRLDSLPLTFLAAQSLCLLIPSLPRVPAALLERTVPQSLACVSAPLQQLIGEPHGPPLPAHSSPGTWFQSLPRLPGHVLSLKTACVGPTDTMFTCKNHRSPQSHPR